MRREPVILGAADGLTIVLGLIVGLVIASQPASAVWHAALSGGIAELVGMTAGMWLSDGDGKFLPALTCGIAACAACVVPAIPYLVSHGAPALIAAVLLLLAVAGLVAWLRPQRGMAAVAQTYGALAAAAVLTAVTAI